MCICACRVRVQAGAREHRFFRQWMQWIVIPKHGCHVAQSCKLHGASDRYHWSVVNKQLAGALHLTYAESSLPEHAYLNKWTVGRGLHLCFSRCVNR